MEEIIKRVGAKDLLNEFYNTHLREFVSANINLMIWNNHKDVNATAYPEPIQTIGPQGQIQKSSRKVSVAEAIEREEFRYYNQQKILRAIKELDKVDIEKEIDRDLKTKFAKIK